VSNKLIVGYLLAVVRRRATRLRIDDLTTNSTVCGDEDGAAAVCCGIARL